MAGRTAWVWHAWFEDPRKNQSVQRSLPCQKSCKSPTKSSGYSNKPLHMAYNLHVASVFLSGLNFIFCFLLPALLLGLIEHTYLQGPGSAPALTLLLLSVLSVLLTLCLATSYLSLGLSFVVTSVKSFPWRSHCWRRLLFSFWDTDLMYYVWFNLGLRTLNCSFVFFSY